ncbi:ApeP family dehydratase [Flocculibacter collagenilyticus]|uniref:ApeP family dehydratase n=1 Tax=Flocculibacter collagenilyticus TaxID=2744479 RepID=UPI0018F3D0E8|nr:3-hydroxylacyl-ACP dehydratase [Flocculibacter collagenilyticus]
MNQYNIEQVISHREPMILIDGMASYTQKSAECWVAICPESPFYQSSLSGVPSYIGIEYMAQAIAAYAGANALDNNEHVKIGFLLGTRKFETHTSIFKLHQKLVIKVEELYQEESGLSVFECTIEQEQTLLASAKINVFQPESPEKFIKEQQ